MNLSLFAASCLAVVASPPHDSASPAPWFDELPLDEWLESARELEPMTLEYRLVNAEGKTRLLEVVLGSNERARCIFRNEEGTERQTVWINDGATTRLIESPDGASQSLAMDIGACVAEPEAWLDESADALGLDARPIPSPRLVFSVWPSDEADRTWDFDISCGISRDSTFGWLDILRSHDQGATLTDEGYVLRLEGGAEVLLDPSQGLILRMDADPEDPEAGRVELIAIETGEELDESIFDADLPDDAEEVPSEALARPQEIAVWKLARFEWVRAVLSAAREDSGFIEAQQEAIEECVARYYSTCFAPNLERMLEGLLEKVDAEADRLLAAWEAAREFPDAREEFEKVRTKILEGMEDTCDRLGADRVATLVLDPEESDNPELDKLIEIERSAAAATIGKALFEPMRDRLNERLEEVD